MRTTRGTGQALYQDARHRIPGGTQLLSKRPEMFLPEQWPSYYARAQGVTVWDLDGKAYIDMSYNGIGACILGHADAEVNAAVHAAVDAGSMSTLNCPEEAELADLLCALHPWADMVRYTRSGGEAMAVAVRIARAHTGRTRRADSERADRPAIGTPVRTQPTRRRARCGRTKIVSRRKSAHATSPDHVEQ